MISEEISRQAFSSVHFYQIYSELHILIEFVAGIGSCLQSFLDNNMSADSEEGECHQVYTAGFCTLELFYRFYHVFVPHCTARRKINNDVLIISKEMLIYIHTSWMGMKWRWKLQIA